MPESYSIRIVAEGQTSKGKPIAVGTVIHGPDAWIHCLPGFRNAPPIAEPVGESTTARVAAELAKRNSRLAVMKPLIQKDVERLAQKLPTDDNGQFIRSADGTISKASKADQITIDSAEAYGIKPPPPAPTVAAESDPEPELPELEAGPVFTPKPSTPPTVEDIAAAVQLEADKTTTAAEDEPVTHYTL